MVPPTETPKPKITLAVTGGIAAYKALDLLRALQTAGLDPHIVLTPSAERFVTPLTFAALTGHKVITSLWDQDSINETPAVPSALASPIAQTRNTPIDTLAVPQPLASPIEHIAEAQSTRLLLIAPATANTLARLAHGLADDFLTTVYLATHAPVLIAPAMNVNMWHHPATVANAALLRERGATIIEPGAGYLACGMTGDGRLADTETIVAAVLEALNRRAGQGTDDAISDVPASQGAPVNPDLSAPDLTTPDLAAPDAAAPDFSAPDLAAESILITAGGTREPIDPVRFIGNRSSGKMGYALAAAALARGARVTLISAPTALAPPAGCEVISVRTAAEMHAATLASLPRTTILIGAAAVSDFRPQATAQAKLKRVPGTPITLTLEPTEDILADAVRQRSAGTLVIAFAAETHNHLANARAKLIAKGVDAVILNDVSDASPDPQAGLDPRLRLNQQPAPDHPSRPDHQPRLSPRPALPSNGHAAPARGFDADENAATFLTSTTELDLPLQPKRTLADALLTQILVLRHHPLKIAANPATHRSQSTRRP